MAVMDPTLERFCKVCSKVIEGKVYRCSDCLSIFCSYQCLDEHECKKIKLPKLVIPWKK